MIRTCDDVQEYPSNLNDQKTISKTNARDQGERGERLLVKFSLNFFDVATVQVYERKLQMISLPLALDHLAIILREY